MILLFACAEPAPPPASIVASPPPTSAPSATGGAEIYVPIYSSVFVREGDQTMDLTVTLTIRNTDRERPLTVDSADLHDRDGKLVHAFLPEPRVLPPLGALDVVVPESDTRAGVGGSFLVDWRGDSSDPVVQAVMIGSAHQQGISLVSEGHVVRRGVRGGP